MLDPKQGHDVCVAIQFKDLQLVDAKEEVDFEFDDRAAFIRVALPEVRAATLALETLGFVLTAIGFTCVVFRIDAERLQGLVQTKLRAIPLPRQFSQGVRWESEDGERINFERALSRFIKSNERLAAAAADVIRHVESITIQRPHVFTSPPPPAIPDVPTPLNVLTGVRKLLRADAVHAAPILHDGTGVKVAMIDSGFMLSHPFFTSNGFDLKAKVKLCGATDPATDPNGHGTGEAANLFATAPGIDFLGIKIFQGSDAKKVNAYLLEAFIAASRSKPDVISLSVTQDLRDDVTGNSLTAIPFYAVALRHEIETVVNEKGIVVVAGTGNGELGFPAQMPSVIAAGGANITGGVLRASNYASAFESLMFPGRKVPDVCGLVGMKPFAAYIKLPVPKDSEIFNDFGGVDKGAKGAWANFSGTSAAAPQIAGVCALLLQKLKANGVPVKARPAKVKQLLMDNAVDVLAGQSGNDNVHLLPGQPTGPLIDRATGAGLVDALAAFNAIV